MPEIPSMTMRVKCVRCMTEFPAPVPTAERINADTFSALVWVHPTLRHCPSCKQAYGFVVQGLKDVLAGYLPVEDPEDKPLIQPATRIPTA